MPASDSSDDGEIYEVEAVVGRRNKNGLEYLLKWKGYDERTWTPVDECGSCKKMVEAFEKANPSTPRGSATTPQRMSARKTVPTAKMDASQSSNGLVFHFSTSSRGRPRKSTAKAAASTPSSRNQRSSNVSKNYRERGDSESSDEEPTTSKKARTQSAPRKPLTLEEVLISTIAVDPFVEPVAGSPAGRKNDSSKFAAVNILKSEELPGIEVWTREAYEEKHKIPAKIGAVEKFGDRDIERIVGFVTHAVHPFILVKVALKKNEKELNVKEAVQAVHFDLASVLIPKNFADYVCRMAHQAGGRKKN